MHALCRLGKDEILRPTHVIGVHPYVQTNPLYFPWFEVMVLFNFLVLLGFIVKGYADF